MQELFSKKQIPLYVFLIIIIITFTIIIVKNNKENYLLKKQMDSISEEVKKMKDGGAKDSKIVNEILKTRYINFASNEEEVSFENVNNSENITNIKDSEQMSNRIIGETKLELHSKFENESRSFAWAQEHEALFWDNFRNWSHLILTSASSEPHFSLDSVECKSSICYIYVHYDKNISIFDQTREVMALLRSVSNCGFTSVGFDNENKTHEWFLHCEKISN